MKLVGDYTKDGVWVKISISILVFILLLLIVFSSVDASFIQRHTIFLKERNYSTLDFKVYENISDMYNSRCNILKRVNINNQYNNQIDYIVNKFVDKNSNLKDVHLKIKPAFINNETWDIVVPDDYSSIQEAIDHAHPYSKIYVRSGLYNEQIVIDVQALYLAGENLFTTVILGKENETTVKICSFLVTITGFNISYSNIGLAFSGYSPTFNTISGNTFFKNNIGIQIGGIERSTLIYHNNFLKNTFNAIDPYENSMWYDPIIQQGNFWDDYTGVDIDGNGIGDIPYNITGNDTKDYYPLMSFYCTNCTMHKPLKPIGNLKGYINHNYSYSSYSSDPRGLDLYYWFDWGDGINTGWVGPKSSGISCNASHTWQQKGTYNIRVRVKNTEGTMSIWSDPLTVSMPKGKAKDIPLFIQRFLQCFPFFEKILKQF